MKIAVVAKLLLQKLLVQDLKKEVEIKRMAGLTPQVGHFPYQKMSVLFIG